jgi:hypothetical protein
MALDRLIAEVILLVGSLYLGYALFTVVNHMGIAITFMRNINEIGSTSIYVPDAVIVNNGSANQLYLVIYNNGRMPISIERIYLGGVNGTIPITMNNTAYLTPGNYIILHQQVPYTQCRVYITFCIANTTICMVYSTNTTNYILSQP